MGTTSEKILEKLNSLIIIAEENQQEISRYNKYLENLKSIIDQLVKLEEKLDYIKTLPDKKDEKLQRR